MLLVPVNVVDMHEWTGVFGMVTCTGIDCTYSLEVNIVPSRTLGGLSMTIQSRFARFVVTIQTGSEQEGDMRASQFELAPKDNLDCS